MNAPFTVVLVDDDEGHAALVRANLERSGIEGDFMHFSSGRKAVEFLTTQAKGVFLVLLDINMPGWDGHQVLQALRANPRTQSLPVIVLTTAEDEKEVARCYTLGCNFYMPKPMEYPDLCESMKNLRLFLGAVSLPPLPSAA